MSAPCKLAADYVCATVCDGKTFWLPETLQTTPRKCTQGRVQFCRRRKVGEGDDDDANSAGDSATHEVLVKKIFTEHAAYAREKAALVRCSAASGDVHGSPMFPCLVSHDDAGKHLWMTYCGEPVTPATIPTDCMTQVASLGRALSRAGINHSDLVPHNVLISATGSLSLIDFGRATTFSPGARGDKQRRVQKRAVADLGRTVCSARSLTKYMKEQLNRRQRPSPLWWQKSTE